MQIGIYSPRPALLEEGRAAVEEFTQASYQELEVHTFSSHEELMSALKTAPLDVLFYDTFLSEALEDRVWEAVRVLPNGSLVLLGDDTHHALFGYAVKAVGYLLTPLDPEELIDALARLVRERMEAKEQFLPVKIEGIWSRLNMEHIVYLQSDLHRMIFHMDDGREIRNFSSYQDYRFSLAVNPRFCRCHKSYMVNLDHVTGMEPACFLMDNGEQISISRPYRQEARSLFAAHISFRYDPRKQSTEKKPPPPELTGPIRKL